MAGNTNTWGNLFNSMTLELSSGDRWTLTRQGGHLSPGPQWKEYVEHASARFRCPRCRHSWNSVHVTLFFYMNLQKRTVKGRILKQYCKDCGDEAPGTPNFVEEDINIIRSNLQIHIRWQCYGEYVDAELLQVLLRGNTQGHHRSDLCEACHLGVCTWTSPKWRPEGYAKKQQLQRSEPKKHVEIPIPHSKSKGKPVHEDTSWNCCNYICCVLIGLLVFFVIRHWLF